MILVLNAFPAFRLVAPKRTQARSGQGTPEPSPLSERALAEAMRDSGLSGEELLGRTADATVPFFLRPGFGSRAR